MQTPQDEPLSKPDSPPIGRRAKSAIKAVLLFTAHQVISTLGFIILAPFPYYFAHDIAGLVSLSLGKRLASAAHELNLQYYPVQIISALMIGWLISRRFKHRSMLWIWILPLAFLCYALAEVPTFFPMLIRASQPHQTAWVHYFGARCDGCTAQFADQMWVTLPFYTSTFYSLGALLARKMPENARSTFIIEFSIVFALGLVLLVGPIIEASAFLRYFRVQHLFEDTPQSWRLPLAIFGVSLGLICVVAGTLLVRNAIAVLRKRRLTPPVTVSS